VASLTISFKEVNQMAIPNPRFIKRTCEPRRAIYQYYATGQGNFPVDMLRYNQCWPASTDDALNLLNDDPEDLRSISLLSHVEPTIERWSSFGWSIGVEKL
jgi:hypothetical protein